MNLTLIKKLAILPLALGSLVLSGAARLAARCPAQAPI